MHGERSGSERRSKRENKKVRNKGWNGEAYSWIHWPGTKSPEDSKYNNYGDVNIRSTLKFVTILELIPGSIFNGHPLRVRVTRYAYTRLIYSIIIDWTNLRAPKLCSDRRQIVRRARTCSRWDYYYYILISWRHYVIILSYHRTGALLLYNVTICVLIPLLLSSNHWNIASHTFF